MEIKQRMYMGTRRNPILRFSIISAFIFIASSYFMKWLFTSNCDDGSAFEMEQFLVRSLLDNMPQLSDSVRGSSDDGIPIDKIIIHPTAHPDNAIPSIVDGVEEARKWLSLGSGGKSTKIILNDVDNDALDPPIPNYNGTPYILKRLEERNIDGITLLPRWKEKCNCINSLNELEKVIQYCRSEGIEALIIVSTPYHIMRSFLSGLSVASRIYPTLKIYAKAAKPREEKYWAKVVAHSQGLLIGARKDFISSEIKRIRKYTSKGDLISIKEALSILNHRDQSNKD